MAKYTVFIDCVATKTYEIEAESANTACKIAEQMIKEDGFFNKYRKECDILEANVSDTVIDENDSFIDRYDEEE